MSGWIPFIGYTILIVVVAILSWSRFHKFWQRITILGSSAYLIILCRLCLTPIVFNFMTANRNLRYFHGVPYNLVAFQQIDMEWFLNIVMTVPFGVLLYLCRPKLRPLTALIIGCLFSCFIEDNQFVCDFLFNIGRVADVDDIITNTIGALLGFIVIEWLDHTFLHKIIKPFTLA